MSAIIFIVETLLSLALFVVLARLLLQWTRADFRNPICQAVVRLTNPLILPLRRVLPPIGKLDTASVVAVLLVAIVEVAVHLRAARRRPARSAPVGRGRCCSEIARMLLWTYLLRDFSLCAAQPHRPGRLFAAAVGAGHAVRAGAAAVPAADPSGRGTGSFAAVGDHRHPGDCSS